MSVVVCDIQICRDVEGRVTRHKRAQADVRGDRVRARGAIEKVLDLDAGKRYDLGVGMSPVPLKPSPQDCLGVGFGSIVRALAADFNAPRDPPGLKLLESEAQFRERGPHLADVSLQEA